MLLAPEGKRTIETVRIYTETLLQMPDEKQHLDGDHVQWQGKFFKVQTTQDWNQLASLGHYKFYAERIEPDTAAARSET